MEGSRSWVAARRGQSNFNIDDGDRIGGAGALAPVLRIGSRGTTGTTFNNLFRTTQNATLEHLTGTTDTISGATFGITSGRTLTVNVAAGGLAISGAIADPSNPNIRGGTLRKMGNDTTLSLTGTMRVAGLNAAEGRLEVRGSLNLNSNPIIGANATLSLQNTSAVTPSIITFGAAPTTISIPTGTLEGLPGGFGAATNVLSLTGGTLNLGVPGGLTAHLYDTGSATAQAAFGGPLNPARTFTDYLNYFTGRGAGTVTSTGVGGVTELSFGSAFGNTAMYAVLAPSYTRTDEIVSRFNGKIIITTPGLYTFATDSDDGSMLFIDGATVVSNNASQAHVRRTGQIELSAGFHDIDIGYYEGGGLNGLIVDYSGPDTADVQKVIPNSVLVPSTDLQWTFQNPITVSQNAVINVAAVSVPSVKLTASGKTLTVNGPRLDMGVLDLITGGAGTYIINANSPYGEVNAKSIAAGGAVVALVNNGPGTLILDAPSSPQTMGIGSTVTVTNGALGLVLGGANSPLGNATFSVNGHGLTLSSVIGNQTMALPAFNLGGSITARKIGSGVAGTAGTPIRMTLTGNLALDNGTTLNLGAADNYVLAMPGGISGNATVNINGTVETTGVVNVGGPLNVNVSSRLNVNGGSVSGGPIAVNAGATLSLGADDVLGNFSGGPSSVTVNGGTVTALAGTHSTLPSVTLNGGTIGATGPGNAPAGPTINYILNGDVTTVPSATPSRISAPAILLRGAGVNGPVTFTVPRGTAERDLAVTSVIHDGGAGLIKNGDGIMALSGVNTYSGPTVISGGTVVTNNASSLGSSSVTLSNGGVISLTSLPSLTGFGNVSLNGGATVDPTNSIITLTTNLGNQARSVFTQSRHSVADGFTASFVYTASGNRAADGITFTVQNSAPNAVGGLGGQLGYVGIVRSAALELNIYTGGGQPIGTNFAVGTAGTYLSSAPVNLGSGNPIKVDVIYNSAALTLTETLTDQVTGAIYTNTFAVPDLGSILVGDLAYIGFTGATGGSFATQTVGSFSFDNYSQQARTLANDITVSAGATGGVDVVQAGPGAAGSAALTGILTLNAGSIFNVTGGATATDTPYLLNVTGSTVLTGNSTIDVANNGTGEGTLQLDAVSGSAFSLTKTGEGTLALGAPVDVAVLNANEGTTAIIASQTLTALNIGTDGVVVLGGSAPAPLAFDAETAGATAQAVPEPGSLSLLLLGAFGLLGRRRPKRP